MQIPQAKPWLVRLASFRVGVRPGRTARCVRTEILAVLHELVGSDGIVTLHDVAVRLNTSGDVRRAGAIQRAMWRMVHRARPGDPVLEAVGPGRYRIGAKSA